MQKAKKQLILHLIQIITLYNAILHGWDVIRVENNVYKLTKNFENTKHAENIEDVGLGFLLKGIIPNAFL